MSQNYVLKNVSKLCPEKYVSENVLKNENVLGKRLGNTRPNFWPEKQAKISGQNFWPEIKFWPADELPRWEEWKKIVFPQQGVIDLPSRQINDFLPTWLPDISLLAAFPTFRCTHFKKGVLLVLVHWNPSIVDPSIVENPSLMD